MSIAVALIVLGLAGLAASVFLALRASSGTAHRERESGLAAMRELSWKEFSALVVKAFETRGFKQLAGARRPGDDGVDQVLERGGQRHILQMKHGGAYHVGAAAVRRLLTVMDQQQAAGGVLATSGVFDNAAREAAKRQPVVLLEGEALWQQVGPLLPASAVATAQSRAAQMETASRRRVVSTTAVSLLLVAAGVAMIAARQFGAGPFADAPAPEATTAAASPADPANEPAPAASASPTTVSAEPTSAEPARVDDSARLPPRKAASPQELATQRDIVAASLLLVDGVVSASWQEPSNTTLVLALRAGDDAKRAEVIKHVCEVILARDELSFTRLQIYDFNLQGDAEKNVRFRQCQ